MGSNTFCFIENLCAIKDNEVFEKPFREIYLAVLELKKENASNDNINT